MAVVSASMANTFHMESSPRILIVTQRSNPGLLFVHFSKEEVEV